MKKTYVVGITYAAEVYVTVEAKSEAEAEALALNEARSTVPYDQLGTFVTSIDEEEQS